MAERRGGGAGFLWFTVGFLAGVLATLVAMVALNGRHARQEEPAPASETAAPAPAPRPQRHVLAPPPEPPPPPESSAAASSAPIDPQVAEDAAAAGMTSRTAPQSQ